jgi:hypothetical protein
MDLLDGTLAEHYRCYRVHVINTNTEGIGDTVEFFPQHIKIPTLSSADAAMQAASDLIYVLEHPMPATPFDIGNVQVQAIQQLANIFQHATKPKKTTTDDGTPNYSMTPTLDRQPKQGPDYSAAPRVGDPVIISTQGMHMHQHFT